MLQVGTSKEVCSKARHFYGGGAACGGTVAVSIEALVGEYIVHGGRGEGAKFAVV